MYVLFSYKEPTILRGISHLPNLKLKYLITIQLFVLPHIFFGVLTLNKTADYGKKQNGKQYLGFVSAAKD